MEIFEQKILILGPESSGKTTMWFQLTMFDDRIEQKLKIRIFEFFKPQIYHHLLHMTKQSEKEPYKTLYTYDPKTLYRELLDEERKQENQIESIEKISIIFKNKALIDEKTEKENFFEYFSDPDNIKRYQEVKYIPSYLDIIYTKKKETETSESLVTVNHSTYYLTDIGSKQQERKDWRRALKSVDILLYIVPLDQNDQKMKEILDEYVKTINGEWFKESKVLIVFNKADKIKDEKKIIKKLQEQFINPFNQDYRISFVIGSCYKDDVAKKVYEELNILSRVNRMSVKTFDNSKLQLILQENKMDKKVQRKSYENSPKRKSLHVWLGGKSLLSKSFSDKTPEYKIFKETVSPPNLSLKKPNMMSFVNKRPSDVDEELDQFHIPDVKSPDVDSKYCFTPESFKVLGQPKETLSKFQSFINILKNPKKKIEE